MPIEHFYLQVFINFKIEINKSVPEKENLWESLCNFCSLKVFDLSIDRLVDRSINQSVIHFINVKSCD